MLIIGSHVSFTKDKGLVGSVLEAISYNANTFMIYTGAPQNTNRSSIDLDNVNEAHGLMKKNNIDNIIVHAPYIINLANPKNLDFGITFLKQEINRCNQLGIKNMVLHPGSAVGLSKEEAINNIVNGLKEVLKEKKDVNICLETMSGKGTEIGSTFLELKQIIDGVNNTRIKICMDTCHMNDAGYSINDFDKVLNEFDEIIGIEKIACIHINDSINDIGTHKDRHANIGFGTLGFDNILNVIYNEKLKNIPKILETPYVSMEENGKDRTYPPYKFEIEEIKNKKFNSNLLSDIRNSYKN